MSDRKWHLRRVKEARRPLVDFYIQETGTISWVTDRRSPPTSSLTIIMTDDSEAR